VAEYDTPAALLKKEDGIFARLCRGSADWQELKVMVKDS
jgi:ABC-type multidrug transport system fused ATPase/permease subunit